MTRVEQLSAAQLTRREVLQALAALAHAVEPVAIHYQWRLSLSDPNDELVLEAAMNGQADWIVTFNRKDFAAALSRFEMEVVAPAEALQRMR